MIKTIFTLIGFLLFLFGIMSLALTLVGVKLAMLTFLDAAGSGIGFGLKLLMVFGGIIMIYLSRTEFDGGTMPD